MEAITGLQSLGDMVFFAPAEPEQLERIIALEQASYPDDEAATPEKLKMRIQQASGAFMVALSFGDDDSVPQPQLVGFICGTCTHQRKLTHACMSKHDPDGHLLCIHSVVVDGRLRRKGIATRMLKAYVPYVQSNLQHVKELRLICKTDLTGLYAGVGFAPLGPSDVVHGADPWFEMVQQLPGAEEEAGEGGGQAGSEHAAAP